MTAEIVNIHPTHLEEFYISKNYADEGICFCEAELWYDITASLNHIRSFIVTIHYEVRNAENEIISILKTRTDFELSHISANAVSLEALEQCTYIAYSEMLKHHQEKYHFWSQIVNEPAIPDEEDVRHDLNKILINLPY